MSIGIAALCNNAEYANCTAHNINQYFLYGISLQTHNRPTGMRTKSTKRNCVLYSVWFGARALFEVERENDIIYYIFRLFRIFISVFKTSCLRVAAHNLNQTEVGTKWKRKEKNTLSNENQMQ